MRERLSERLRRKGAVKLLGGSLPEEEVKKKKKPGKVNDVRIGRPGTNNFSPIWTENGPWQKSRSGSVWGSLQSKEEKETLGSHKKGREGEENQDGKFPWPQLT